MITQASNAQLQKVKPDVDLDPESWEDLKMRLEKSEEFQQWLNEDDNEL